MNYAETKTLIESLGVHAQLGPEGHGYGIEQNAHELATFLCSLPNIQTVLEIGTGYRAGLARFMTEHLGWEVTTISMHHPQTPAPLARQVIGKSVDVVGKVYGRYDLVIIDGDHTYDAVKLDAALYASMGSVVMFHDIAGLRDCEGSARHWQEISRDTDGNMRRGYHECIAEGQTAAGIGWLIKSEVVAVDPKPELVKTPVVTGKTPKKTRRRK